MPNRLTRGKMITAVGIVWLATCVLATEVLAQPPGGRGGGPGQMMAGMRALDLTDEQHNEIRHIAERYRESDGTQREQHRAARAALREATTADVVSESTIRALAAEVALFEADAAVRRAYMHAEMLQVLTPDQRAQLQELRAEREERRGLGSRRSLRP